MGKLQSVKGQDFRNLGSTLMTPPPSEAEAVAEAGDGAGPRSATIATIAEEVGVSVATVSKVLNGRSDVAQDTRIRVEASLERHRYRRRAKRQAPGAGQIELVFHQLGSPWA